MICDSCGQEGSYVHESTRAYGTGDRLVVIENVPIISCRNCGIDLLSAETLHHLDDLRAYLRSNHADEASVRPVKVADYQTEVPSSSRDTIELDSVG